MYTPGLDVVSSGRGCGCVTRHPPGSCPYMGVVGELWRNHKQAFSISQHRTPTTHSYTAPRDPTAFRERKQDLTCPVLSYSSEVMASGRDISPISSPDEYVTSSAKTSSIVNRRATPDRNVSHIMTRHSNAQTALGPANDGGSKQIWHCLK